MAQIIKWTFRAGLGAAGVLVLTVLVILLMTLWGPVSLSMISPRLQAMINEELKDFEIRFADTTLDWSSSGGAVTLTLVGVEVVDKSGVPIARAPRLSLGLSASALFQGRAVPEWIELERPVARVSRTAAGDVQFGLVLMGDAANAAPKGSPAGDKAHAHLAVVDPVGAASLEANALDTALFDKVLAILRNPSEGGDMSRSLRRFAVTDAALEVIDDLTGLRLAIPNARVELLRQDGKVTASLRAGVRLSDQSVWPIQAEADLPDNAEGAVVAIKTGTVPLDQLARSGVGPQLLKAFQFPLSAQAKFIMGKGGRSGPIRVWLTGGAGQVMPDNWAGKPMPLGGFTAVATIDPNERRGVIDRMELQGPASKGALTGGFALGADDASGFALDLTARGISLAIPAVFEERFTADEVAFKGTIGGAGVTFEKLALRREAFQITLAGSFAPSAVSPGVTLNGRFSGLPVTLLKQIWPIDAAPNARFWVRQQLTGGVLTSGEINVALVPDTIQNHTVPDEAVTVAFDFDQLAGNYLDGMPPLTQARGRATLRGDTFEVDVASADLGPVSLSSGKVMIPQLHLEGTVAAISGEVREPMKNILLLLDSPRLGYPTRFGIKPDSVAGQAAVAASFNVPMLKDLKAESVGIDVKGQTKGLGVKLSDAITVAKADWDVAVTGAGLSASGPSHVNGIPMRVTWLENFMPSDRPPTTLEADAVLDDAGRERFGISLAPYVEGPVRFRAGFSGRGGDIRSGTVLMEFDKARISAPELNWAMGPGNKVTATAKIIPRGKGALALNELRAVGPGVSAFGRMFIAGGGIREAAFQEVKLGPANDFSIMATLPLVGEQKYVVTGRALDASALIESLSSTAPVLEDPKVRIKRPYNISATLSEVTMKSDVVLKDVIFRNRTDGIRMRAMDLSAAFPQGGTMRSDLIVQPDGSRRLRLTSNDAGRMVRAVTGLRSVVGGEVSLLADLPKLPALNDMIAMAQDPPPRFSGSLRAENFKVVNQPFLARLFAAGSFAGLGDLLSGEGIAFNKLETGFSNQSGPLQVVDGKASGPSIGVTFQGRFDREADKVAFDGTLVPIYGLNSLFEDIPVVGDILNSRKGEGIIGFTYEVAGRSDDLDIMVNPLSMLTPGIFRRIFQGERMTREQTTPVPSARPAPGPAPAPRQPRAGTGRP